MEQMDWDSLSQAREHLLENLDEGIRCPCCDQLAKRYRRTIYGAMGVWLIRLWRLWRETHDWIHVRDLSGSRLATGSADFAKLRYWNLISQKWNDDLTKRCSGLWIPTAKGIDFVHGRVRVPRHAVVYDDELQGFEGEEISIHNVLPKKFDYRNLMEGNP